MVRIKKPQGWWLLRHVDHAALAGLFADHWGNDEFAKPEPFDLIRTGVARHDDAWIEPDANPQLLPEGVPAGFSKELVGAYSAFEAIDIEAYLAVRGNATEVVAQDAPYGAILISMHTVNLLTEQADLSTLTDEQRELHGEFIEGQKRRQCELAGAVADSADVSPSVLERAFKFLQACDSLSLTVCVQLPTAIDLRHAHPTVKGEEKTIRCTPLGDDRYRLTPYPFDQDTLTFDVPYRELEADTFASVEDLRAAFDAAPVQHFTVTLER